MTMYNLQLSIYDLKTMGGNNHKVHESMYHVFGISLNPVTSKKASLKALIWRMSTEGVCTHGTLHEEGIEQHIPGTETVASRAGIQKVRRVIRHEVGLEGRGHISQGLKNHSRVFVFILTLRGSMWKVTHNQIFILQRSLWQEGGTLGLLRCW